MKSRMTKRLVAIHFLPVIAAAPLLVLADDETPSKKSHSVRDLAWMAGSWSGEIFRGPLHETWGAPVGDTILGMSRIGDDPSHTMYELLLLEKINDDVFMFLRHFQSTLGTSEEAPMKFKLTSLEKKTAVFQAEDKKLRFNKISYHRKDSDTLLVTLEGGTPEKPLKFESAMKKSDD